MGTIIGRTWNGQAVSFQADATPIEVDAVAAAEAAIGGASGNQGTAVAGAVTMNNATSGVITTQSLSTATGASTTITLTSNLVKATSVVLANVTLGSATQGTASITHVTCASGSVAFQVKNIDGTNAFNGTLKIGFAIFQ